MVEEEEDRTRILLRTGTTWVPRWAVAGVHLPDMACPPITAEGAALLLDTPMGCTHTTVLHPPTEVAHPVEGCHRRTAEVVTAATSTSPHNKGGACLQ